MTTYPHRLSLGRRLLLSGVGISAAALAFALHEAFPDFIIGRQAPNGAVSTPPDQGAARSELFAFSFHNQPRAVPDLKFIDREGRSLSLADFHTRPILLNIWATWCVPCRKEMPSLDRLQAKLGTSQLLVLPLSIDRQGLPVVEKFYAALGLNSLGMYVDQSGGAAGTLNAVGVPTTLLIDRDGYEIGRKVGPAEWDSPDVVALLRRHFALSAERQAASP